MKRMKYMTGGVANPNAKAAVQKVAGSKGVGPTKNAKASAQKAAGSNGVGHTKSKKATVSPASKKKNVK